MKLNDKWLKDPDTVLVMQALQKKGNKALFVGGCVRNSLLKMPVIVLTILITYGLLTWSDIMNVDQDEDPMVIELYAQQFNWKARYAGDDGVLGKSNVRLIDIDRANILGLDEFDPNAQDDIITK